jgi:very-short-patch-repair endonuclease
MPTIDWDVDGYGADFEILGSKAIIKVDTWSFSIAFEKDVVRDQVLAGFRSLSPDHFQP